MKKLKGLIIAFCTLLTVFHFVSCSVNADGANGGQTTENNGIISGKVVFSNLEENQNQGIIVSLDKTDGLRTESVTASVKARSIKPAARTLVSSVMTSEDGSYTFENLAAGIYTVYASSTYSSEKAVCTNVVVRAAETTVADILKLTATGSISGKITLDSALSGNTGFLVFVAGTSYMAMTDDAGNYKISEVPAGSGYQVVATKNGIIHNLSSNVTVTANGTSSLADNNFTAEELTTGLKGEKGDKGDDGAPGTPGINGKDGVNGTNGVDGISIVWLGSYDSASEIVNPQKMNAYFNKTDGCSYIYTGTEWTLLAKAGANGSDGKDGLDALAITGVFSTEELTNQNVEITVKVTQSSIDSIGYVYSAVSRNFTNAKAILRDSNFVALTKDSEGKYKFTASANGYYALAVKNTEGYTAFTEEYVSNIDKTAPGAVTVLTSSYNKNTKVIAVNWTNPADEDLAGVKLSYTKGGTAVVSNQQITGTSYSISDVEVDGDEYVFNVFAVDNAGNTGVTATTSITPVDGVKVQAITLNRYHFAYNDADQTVAVTANLMNADLLEDEVVKIQVKDPNGNVINTVATVNKTAGTATATITAPSTSSSNSGVTYTVLCKIGDEAADTTHTARFNVSAAPSLSGLSQSTNGTSFTTSKVQLSLANVTSSTKETVRIQGYNLDLTTPSIQLYNSTGTAYFAEPVTVDVSSNVWTAVSGTNSQTYTVEINVPTVDDTYTVKVLFGGTAQTNYTRTLQVYDVPKFSKLSIPAVSISKEDNTVTATITGKNFDTPDVDISNFSASCTNAGIVASTSFTRKSDSSLTATFTIPGTAGNYTVTVTYGSESVTGTLKAADFSAYTIGSVLLNDGTIIPYDAENLIFTDEQKAKAVGVLYGFNDDDVPCGWLGLYNSASGTNSDYKEWAPSGTTGYNTKFNDIICTPSTTGSGAASTATFTGDTDGSDNWAYICSIDPAGTADAATNYPAFNYVNNYASTFGLTGDYAQGWYLPSVAELCYIYRNKTVLNSVLSALSAIQLASGYYWSSSQNSDYDFFAWLVNLSDGFVYYYGYKSESNRVCCVRAFNY